MKKEVCIKEKTLEKCQYCDNPYERVGYRLYCSDCYKKLKRQKEEGPVLIHGENVKLQLFDYTQKGFVVTQMACTNSYVYLLMEKPKTEKPKQDHTLPHDTHIMRGLGLECNCAMVPDPTMDPLKPFTRKT